MKPHPAPRTLKNPARVVQIVVGSLVAIVAILAAIGAVLPNTWRVQSSVMINASPAEIHPLVNDLRHWPQWAQWDQQTLAPHNTFSGPRAGVGAMLHWRSDTGTRPEAQGTVRIVRSEAAAGVWFENTTGTSPPARASLTYGPGPGVTEVTWTDSGRLPPIVGGLFRDLFQTQLARHMERGLMHLKDLAEAPVRRPLPPAELHPPADFDQADFDQTVAE